jgi:hypothetical protein
MFLLYDCYTVTLKKLVAGVVLRYCATQPMTFELPDLVYVKGTLIGGWND